MNTEVVLVNYRIPVPLKEQFEAECRQLHMPMTSQIKLLIREFLYRQKHARDEPNDLHEPVSFYSGMDDTL
jgi:antitoxin component of RelBE/YafQ-DinJ toxin-antitoxin module